MREGWVNINMVDACDLITCGVAARPKYVDEGIPFLSAKNVKEGKILFRDYNCITFENHQELTKKNKPLIGDLLYTRVGSYGEAAVIEEDVEFSVFVSLTLIKPKRSLLNSYFLKYYLNSHEVKTLAKKSITSSGVGNLNVGTVRKFPVKIPPLEEQKEIVSILDDAFASIDKAKANIERNIENAKELFQSKLNEIFSQTGKGWEENELGKIYDVRDGTHDSPKYQDNGYALITSKNLKNNSINLDKIKFISKSDFNNINKRSKVDVGDVLFAMIGTIGNPVVIQSEPNFAIKNVALFKVPKNQNSLFLKFFLDFSNEKMIKESKGSTQRFVGLGYLRNYLIRIPDLLKQNEVVDSLCHLENLIKSSISNYEKDLENLEELKKSILQKAFSGELTNKSVAA